MSSVPATSVSGGRRARGAAFLVGVALIAVGAGLHIADWLSMADMDYRMTGMGFSVGMGVGMGAIFVGLGLASWSLISAATGSTHDDVHATIERLEGDQLRPAHVLLALVATLALAIDVMKPATIGFVLPGLREEYGISKAVGSLLPLVALTGTVIGSFVWGALADRIGRRPAVLLGALLFSGTAICGAMPSFGWNLVMCFFMGMSAGGFLPVILTLVAEVAPRAWRGFTVVLVAGVGSTAGYVAASGLAALLEPDYGWRILWLVGLPTGLLLIALQRALPESYRFLRLKGRDAEAERVMRRFGLRAVPGPPGHTDGVAVTSARTLVSPRYRALTVALSLYALGWGLVNFGFFTWLPTMFAEAGDSKETVNVLLARAALIALPGSLLVALLYRAWSTKRSLVAIAGASVASLGLVGVLVAAGAATTALAAALVLLICGINAMNAMLLPYAAEVYPTEVRGRGTGLVAGMGKLGGLVGIQGVSLLLVFVTGPEIPALILAVPLAAGTIALARAGIETRDRPMNEQALSADAAS